MMSEKYNSSSIQIFIDHLYSATYEKGKQNISEIFLNFACLYAWFTGRSSGVLVKRKEDACLLNENKYEGFFSKVNPFGGGKEGKKDES